jgi:hypothetical protein
VEVVAGRAQQCCAPTKATPPVKMPALVSCAVWEARWGVWASGAGGEAEPARGREREFSEPASSITYELPKFFGLITL